MILHAYLTRLVREKNRNISKIVLHSASWLEEGKKEVTA